MYKNFKQKTNADNISLLYYSLYNKSHRSRYHPVIPLLKVLQKLPSVWTDPQPPSPGLGCYLPSTPISPRMLLRTLHTLSDSVGHPF